ncbi:MAG: SprT family zinc-dependent metalloprotease [Clostridium sp.]
MNINIKYKKVKNITLRIKNDGTVNLTVPFGVSEDYALGFVKKKEKWIKSKLEEIKNRENLSVKGEFKLVSGEVVYYLGNKYTVNILESSTPRVDITGEFINIYVDNVDDYNTKNALLHRWYLDNANNVFSEYINKWEEILKLNVKSITIRSMKTRWGSCNHKLHKINLNLELIKKDIRCIDYVILHEMAHLVHPNHSMDFWGYVEGYMPEYRGIRDMLKSIN